MNELPRRNSLLLPLNGDESGYFELQLVRGALAALENQLARAQHHDDYVFQSHLRFLNALYFLLGAQDFEEKLSTKLCVRSRTVRRWVAGQSAPASSIRVRALAAARELLTQVETQRRLGATLYDLTSRQL